jgi:hypothetical protein
VEAKAPESKCNVIFVQGQSCGREGLRPNVGGFSRLVS